MMYKKSGCTALSRWVITLATVIKNAHPEYAHPECMKYQVFRIAWRHERRTEFLNYAKITETYPGQEYQGYIECLYWELFQCIFTRLKNRH